MSDCFDKVLKELKKKSKNDELTVDEEALRAIVKSIESIRSQSGESADLFAKNVAAFLRKEETALAVERKNVVLDKIKKVRNKNFISQYDDKKVAGGVKAALRGEASIKIGGSISAENLHIEKLDSWANGLERNVEAAGLYEIANSGSLDREASIALFHLKENGSIDMNHPEMRGIPKEAIDYAKVIRKTQNVITEDLTAAGGWIEQLEGYIMKQIHDGNKIIGVKLEDWKAKIGPKLSESKTFFDLDPKEIDSALDDLYEKFTNGFHEKNLEMSATGLVNRLTRGKTLAERVGRSRSLHFKSGQDFYDYNVEFGRDNLFVSTVRSIEANARAYALLEKFGSNPRAGFDDLVKAGFDQIKHDKKLAAKYAGPGETLARENLWKEMTGQTTVYTRNLSSNIASGATSFVAWTKLGAAAPRSLTDLSSAAAVIRSVSGANMFETLGRVSEGYVAMLPTHKRQFWAKELGFSMQTLRENITKNAGIEGGPGAVSRLNNFYYKFNGLQPHTEAVKLTAARIVAVDMAENARVGWKNLGEQLQQNLSRYNIGEAEVGLYKFGIKEMTADGSGSMLVTPDTLENIPIELFKAAKEMNGTKLPVETYRKNVIRDYNIYLHEISSLSTIEPGIGERALLNQGFSSATPIGAAFKIMSQFKSFPLSGIKVLNRIAQSNPKTAFDAKAVGQFMASSMAFAYMADSLIEAAKGKSPRDPRDPNTALLMLQKSGALAMYGDVLLEDYSKNYASITKYAAGPTLSTLDDATSIFSKAVKGDLTAKESFRFGLNNFPFANTFYLRGALDYFFLDSIQEGLSPGYKDKQRNRLQNEGRSLLFDE